VALIFGLILSAAGICGLLLGSGLSFWLRKRFAWIDPVICGGGLLISTPFIFAALYLIDTSVTWAFILMFIGQIFLNMNWAVVVDISLVCRFFTTLHLQYLLLFTLLLRRSVSGIYEL
jgi:hypothetical protein